MKRIFAHIIVATMFAIVTIGITDLCIRIYPDIGWYVLTVSYVSILILQTLYYILFSYTNIWFSALGFTANFILWVAEQVNIEKIFHDSFFYQNDNWRYGVVILGGLLWSVNKLIVDRIYELLKVKMQSLNRLDQLLRKNV
jgi:hypothetical protein